APQCGVDDERARPRRADTAPPSGRNAWETLVASPGMSAGPARPRECALAVTGTPFARGEAPRAGPSDVRARAGRSSTTAPQRPDAATTADLTTTKRSLGWI